MINKNKLFIFSILILLCAVAVPVASAGTLSDGINDIISANENIIAAADSLDEVNNPLTGFNNLFITLSNTIKFNLDAATYGNAETNNGQYWIKFGGGMNAIRMATDPNITNGEVKALTNNNGSGSGTVYMWDGGGTPNANNMILLVSVKGPIDDDFSITIKSTGYSFAEGETSGNMIYQNGITETFTKEDFIYGPQTTKPGSSATILYNGQNTADSSTAEYLMFVDLHVGAVASNSAIENGGAVKVEYDYENMYSHMSFNAYAWNSGGSNQGASGISWTNNPATRSYSVGYNDVTAPTVESSVATSTSFTAPFNVLLSGEDEAGSTSIYYTLDGGNPNKSNASAIKYEGETITISKDTKLRVIAYDSAGNPSDEKEYDYNFIPTVTPSKSAGSFNNAFDLSLNVYDVGGDTELKYVIGDGDPSSGIDYTGPISIPTVDTTVKVYAKSENGIEYTETYVYTFDNILPNVPTASVNTGLYNTNQNVVLTQGVDESDNTIYYTVDGSDPTNESTKYTGAIAISTTTTLKFIAYDNAGNPSNIVTKSYTIDRTAPNLPTASVNTGIYNSNKSVTLSQATGETDNTIYYTLNGSDPTSKSTKYTGAIAISKTSTLKFIAYDSAGNPSNVAIRTYTININVPNVPKVPKAPTASVNTGTYNSNKNVVLKQAIGETANTIYYTTNGANPTSKSTKYTGAIAISKTSTLKFIAYDSAGTPSSVVTRTYTIDKTKPKVTSNVPKNSATKVSKTSAITIKFNEKVVKGSGWNNIYVKNLKTGKKIKITSKTLSKDGKTLTIKTSSRATNVKYDVVVPANAVKDLATNSLSKLLKFIFRSR